MNGGLPERIDPLHLADHHVRLTGQLPLARFERLRESLDSGDGEARIDAAFDRDESGQRIVRLVVTAPVRMICQRCMGPLATTLCVDETLAIVEDEAEADRLGGRYEPLFAGGAAAGRMSLCEIVEDELLLRVPMIPRHEGDGDCRAKPPADDAGSGRSDSNPFAVLRNLKDRG